MIMMTVMIMMVIIIRIKVMASVDTRNILMILVMTVRRSDKEVKSLIHSCLPFHFGCSQQSRREEQRQER